MHNVGCIIVPCKEKAVISSSNAQQLCTYTLCVRSKLVQALYYARSDHFHLLPALRLSIGLFPRELSLWKRNWEIARDAPKFIDHRAEQTLKLSIPRLIERSWRKKKLKRKCRIARKISKYLRFHEAVLSISRSFNFHSPRSILPRRAHTRDAGVNKHASGITNKRTEQRRNRKKKETTALLDRCGINYAFNIPRCKRQSAIGARSQYKCI